MSPDPISVFTKIMVALRLRYRLLNLHYEAAWTDSWTHRRCLHEHRTLIEIRPFLKHSDEVVRIHAQMALDGPQPEELGIIK